MNANAASTRLTIADIVEPVPHAAKNRIQALPGAPTRRARRPDSAKWTAVSLHREILGRLRNYIVEGHLSDGARIPERQLCDLFGISRTPLREALKVLASEGLVDLLPHRGARVRELDARELAELFDVMGGLEALAGRLACERLTAAEFAEIEDLHHQMYAFYLKRDMPEYFRCNQLIHEKVVGAARNAALSAAYASLAGRIRRIRYAANLAQKRDRWGEAIREHEAILDALRRRDGVELMDTMFRHLRNKQAAAMEYLEDNRRDLPDQKLVAAR
jgi:DNA-binding GntR family transcriptional regulator